MGIMVSVKIWIQPQRDPHTLYISIDEIPQPRDWGTLQLAVGNELVMPGTLGGRSDRLQQIVGTLRRVEEVQNSGEGVSEQHFHGLRS